MNDRLRNGVLLVLAFVAVAMLTSRCQASRWSSRVDAAIDRAERAESLAVVNGERSAAFERVANAEASQRRAAQDSARTARAEADRLRAIRRPSRPAESNVGVEPTVPLPVPEPLPLAEALENCEAETVALRAAAAQDALAQTNADSIERNLRAALALERVSVDSLARSNRTLRTSLASAEPPCRIGFVRCPSRTQVALGSAIVTAGLFLAFTR